VRPPLSFGNGNGHGHIGATAAPAAMRAGRPDEID
jgi:hypothetical protein